MKKIEGTEIEIPKGTKVAMPLSLKEVVEAGDHYLYICHVDSVYAD